MPHYRLPPIIAFATIIVDNIFGTQTAEAGKWTPTFTPAIPTETPTPADTPPPSPSATLLPPRGHIAFESDRDDNKEIYIMNADGSGPTNLTSPTMVWGYFHSKEDQDHK